MKNIKKTSFTHHKLATFALHRDDNVWEQFVLDVPYQHEAFIFIDEIGTDNRDTVRQYGYCLRGKQYY